MQEAFIIGAVRTPIGKDGGSLRDIAVEDLAGLVMQEVLKRAGIESRMVDDVMFGCSNQVATVKNIARVAWLQAGLPVHVPATTINRLCGSGLQSVHFAIQTVQTYNADLVLAGGVESMTRSPYVMEKEPAPYRRGNKVLFDSFSGTYSAPTSLYGNLSMGETAEHVAERYQISREDQDAFAYLSHQKAVTAIRAGRFREEITPVRVPSSRHGTSTLFDTDEHPRPDTTLEKLARLKPAFRANGTVTAGNSSGINDGAAALLIASAARTKELGLKPMARVIASAVAAVDPRYMGMGPVEAIPRALTKAGITLNDIGLIELNEAFAAQAVACIRELDLDPELVNLNGGAIALGHPLGCTGARLLCTLLYEMKRRGTPLGLVSMCIGGGQGIASIVEQLP